MEDLERLGITTKKESNGSQNYKVSIPPDFPEEYLERVFNAIYDDASNKNTDISISIDEDHWEGMLKVARKSLREAEKQYAIRQGNNINESLALQKVLTLGGMVAGGVSGTIIGYDLSAKFGTQVADYLNRATYFLAPVSGLLQVAVSVGGTSLALAGGVFLGGLIGSKLSYPYVCSKTPLAERLEDYSKLERAIINAERFRNSNK